MDMAATRVRLALACASLACSLAGIALLVLWAFVLDGALVWVLLAEGVNAVAMVLGFDSLQADPKGGPWHWLAVTAFVLPVVLLFLPLVAGGLLIYNLYQTN